MRLRTRFTKLGKVRFTSHRDLARLWERALKRAEVPVARTQGYSPRPKLHFGLALPTGAESTAEFLDLDLDPARLGDAQSDPVREQVAEMPALLTELLPLGVSVVEVAEVDPKETSLQQSVTSCTWVLQAADHIGAGQLDEAIGRVLAADTIELERERKGRRIVDDVRPAILDLRSGIGTGSETEGAWFEAELATTTRGLRPAELLEVLGLPTWGRACRTHQWIDEGGAKREPLGATPLAHAEACAT